MENPKLLEASDKMKVVAGNLAELKLGLNSKDYDELCESVDTIIHNGAVVNSVLPYPGMLETSYNTIMWIGVQFYYKLCVYYIGGK